MPRSGYIRELRSVVAWSNTSLPSTAGPTIGRHKVGVLNDPASGRPRAPTHRRRGGSGSCPAGHLPDAGARAAADLDVLEGSADPSRSTPSASMKAPRAWSEPEVYRSSSSYAHRHYTYPIGMTTAGVQRFRYRILYLAPEFLQDALAGAPLPFVAEPAHRPTPPTRAVLSLLCDFDDPVSDPSRVEIALAVSEALVSLSGRGAGRAGPIDLEAVHAQDEALDPPVPR